MDENYGSVSSNSSTQEYKVVSLLEYLREESERQEEGEPALYYVDSAGLRYETEASPKVIHRRLRPDHPWLPTGFFYKSKSKGQWKRNRRVR